MAKECLKMKIENDFLSLPGQFSYHVSVFQYVKKVSICGGSIISPGVNVIGLFFLTDVFKTRSMTNCIYHKERF